MHFLLEECTVRYQIAYGSDTSILHYGRGRCGAIVEDFKCPFIDTICYVFESRFFKIFNIHVNEISLGVSFVLYTSECVWGRDLIVFHEKWLQILGVLMSADGGIAGKVISSICYIAQNSVYVRML